jgi:hypothetical protein
MGTDFRYGTLVVATMTPALFADLGHAVVDREVIPPFDGRPDDIAVHLVVATRAEADAARADLPRLAERAKAGLRDAGFPVAALATLAVLVTSYEEIEDGGGRFYYFR